LVQQNATRVRSGWSGAEPRSRMVVVRDIDLQYTHVSLTGEEGCPAHEDEWCFPRSQRRVDSQEALDHLVSEMILLGCAESVVNYSHSIQKEKILRQLALDLGVRYEHGAGTDPNKAVAP
jgi:hypothetical protein